MNMKLTDAWGEAQKVNNVLKIAVITLCLAETVTAILAMKSSNRDPIVVERGCFTKAITPANAKFTQSELASFVKEALSYRFDTEVKPNSDFMSADELAKRAQEQKEFSQKNISQVVLVREIKAAGDKVSVVADRVLAVGNVRSALPFPLTLSFDLVSRTQSNPYGIELSDVEEVKEAKGSSEAKQ
jgi:hypothetical protein